MILFCVCLHNFCMETEDIRSDTWYERDILLYSNNHLEIDSDIALDQGKLKREQMKNYLWSIKQT
jgi:hypothetical protein